MLESEGPDGDDERPTRHSVTALEPAERSLLFDLVRTRLATTITLLHWRLAARKEDDPYRQKTHHIERGASGFLAALGRLGRTAFLDQLERALGR